MCIRDSAETDHLEGVRRGHAGHADAAARPEGDLALQALPHGGEVAVAQLRNHGMAGVIERNLVGRARAALNAVDEEAPADLVGIAQEVVVDGDRGVGGRALDGHGHAEAEGRVQGEVHLCLLYTSKRKKYSRNSYQEYQQA